MTKHVDFLIGGYARAEDGGVVRARLDLDTGAMQTLGIAAHTVNPSWLAWSIDGHALYSVSESGPPPEGSTVSAWRWRDEGELERLSQQKADGGPCYLGVHPNGKWVYGANYGGGSVDVFPVERDGSLGPSVQTLTHEGAGAHPKRQQRPHTHMAQPDPAGKLLYAPDLGANTLFVYTIGDDGRLTPAPTPTLVPPGDAAGPRHVAFHPTGPWAYLINELDGTVCVLDLNHPGGLPSMSRTLGITKGGTVEDAHSGAIIVHPNGKTAYATNRGEDTIAIMEIHPFNGSLQIIDHVSTEGDLARDLTLTPDGRWLLSANQGCDCVVSFTVEPESGMLRDSGHRLETPKPTCVLCRA